jgi:hypothetical protein
MLISCWLMYGVAAVTIALRLAAKLRISCRWGLDDGLIFLALVCCKLLLLEQTLTI